MSVLLHVGSRIRTGVATATTWSTNHYTNPTEPNFVSYDISRPVPRIIYEHKVEPCTAEVKTAASLSLKNGLKGCPDLEKIGASAHSCWQQVCRNTKHSVCNTLFLRCTSSIMSRNSLSGVSTQICHYFKVSCAQNDL